MIKKVCSGCGKEFFVRNHRDKTARFCSKKCHDYAGSCLMNCVVCGKEYRRPRSHMNYDTKVCGKSCLSVAKKRKSTKPSKAIAARGWMRRRGLMNDCQICGYNKHPEILVVHHIDRDRDNNSLENLIVVCPNCHAIEHYLKSSKNAFETREIKESHIN